MTTLTQVLIALSALVAAAISVYNSFKIQEVHMLVNSRLTELLEISRAASKAEGVLEGRGEKAEELNTD